MTEVELVRLFSLFVVSVLLGAGCTSEGAGARGGPTTSGGDSTMDPEGTSNTDDGPIPMVGEPDTEPVTSRDFPSAAGEVAHLVDVRVAGHDGFDRVVLEFAGRSVPSYRVRHVEPPIRQDGSGEVMSVPGEAFLELRLTPASGWDLGGPRPRRIYTGPERVDPPHARAITEAVRTGDFEATLAWTVGLTHRAPFAVAIFDEPLRLVVDVRHERTG